VHASPAPHSSPGASGEKMPDAAGAIATSTGHGFPSSTVSGVSRYALPREPARLARCRHSRSEHEAPRCSENVVTPASRNTRASDKRCHRRRAAAFQNAHAPAGVQVPRHCTTLPVGHDAPVFAVCGSRRCSDFSQHRSCTRYRRDSRRRTRRAFAAALPLSSTTVLGCHRARRGLQLGVV